MPACLLFQRNYPLFVDVSQITLLVGDLCTAAADRDFLLKVYVSEIEFR